MHFIGIHYLQKLYRIEDVIGSLFLSLNLINFVVTPRSSTADNLSPYQSLQDEIFSDRQEAAGALVLTSSKKNTGDRKSSSGNPGRRRKLSRCIARICSYRGVRGYTLKYKFTPSDS